MSPALARDSEFLRNVVYAARGLTTAYDAHLRSLGLTASRAQVLLGLAERRNGMNQSDVAGLLHVEHPTAVRILDGLEDLGLIRREPAPHDRRAKVILLTSAGAPIAAQVVEASKRLNAALMDGLDDRDVEVAGEVLLRLRRNESMVAERSTTPLAEVAQ
jgi:MarR family transcriptional regulator for hemolysin